MAVSIGYLLPTRENIMEGRPEGEPLLQLAERAEAMGYDSVWVGDSLLARPRHEPPPFASMIARTVRRHRPHSAPAQHASATCLDVAAPAATAWVTA